MTKVLAVSERRVDDDRRSEYLTSLGARRSAAASTGVAFWVFEHMGEPGRFIEFTEGADASAVAATLSDQVTPELWREVGNA